MNMNREIKFRAWDKATNRMLAEGFSVIGEVTCFGIIEMELMKEPLGRATLDRIGDVVLMQYTGLKDKNGKEIYEGDIWKERISTINGFVEITFTIVYDDEYAAFAVMVDSNEEDTREINRSWANEVEIVGNIYETQHLFNSEQSVKESDTTKAT